MTGPPPSGPEPAAWPGLSGVVATPVPALVPANPGTVGATRFDTTGWTGPDPMAPPSTAAHDLLAEGSVVADATGPTAQDDPAEPPARGASPVVRGGPVPGHGPAQGERIWEQQFDPEPRDWEWVEQWRAGGEPAPWGPGLTVAGFTLFLVASALYVLSSGLADRPILAVLVNGAVAAGLAPALWLSRRLPVLRWIAGGAALGVLTAWVCVLVF